MIASVPHMNKPLARFNKKNFPLGALTCKNSDYKFSSLFVYATYVPYMRLSFLHSQPLPITE